MQAASKIFKRLAWLSLGLGVALIPLSVTEGTRIKSVQAADLSDEELKEICMSDVTIYEFKVRALARRRWSPPRPPSKGVWSTILAYRVKADGEVINIESQSSSGHLPFDESALTAVKRLNGPVREELVREFPKCVSAGYVDVVHDFVLTDL